MRLTPAYFVGLCGMLFALQGHAVAPVVDDSDNFTVFDEQGNAPTSSKSAPSTAMNDEEPLAKAMPEDKTQSMSLRAQVGALQQEIQSLRGELEVQAHAIEQLKQQMSLNKDMEPRTQSPSKAKNTPAQSLEVPAPGPQTKPENAAETKTPTSQPKYTAQPETSSATSMGSATKNPADEQIAYLAAYDLVKAKRYNDALAAMQVFVKQYPRSGYTANAEYWIGELFLVKNLPAQAVQHFENVLNQFPTSSKAAASALKIGYALSAMGQKEDAKMRFKEVIKNYPDTAAAQLAKSKLEGL
jgi:tol-pal system protein YbgF